MTGPATTTAAKAADVEYEIDVLRIHPDPVQPRIHPDAELAESIKSQGILQAIRLEKIQGDNVPDIECPDCGVLYAELALEGGHYMIQDGERRFRGSLAAGRKTVLAKIVAPASEGDRLVAQVTSNTGKPLTPIEEALAYKRIMESKEITQAELAKLVGRPKSVIGDRIRLIELDPVWLDLISSGKLQVSHGPILSTFSAVPEQYQKKAAANLLEDYRAKRFLDEGDKIPVDEMRHLLYVSFRDYIKPMSEVPGYRGPVIQISGRYGNYGGRSEKYAADIAIWRPIFNKRQNKRRREMQRNASSSFTSSRKRDQTIELLEDLPKRKSSEYNPNAHKGEVLVYEQDSGWKLDGIPDVFLSLVDPAKLTRVFAQHSAGIVTSDLASVKAAQEALDAQLKKKLEGKLSEIRGVMRSKKLEEFHVSGPGCKYLLSTAEKWNSPLPVIALAMGLPNPGIDTEDDYEDDNKIQPIELTTQQAATLAAGYLAYRAGVLKVPPINAAKDEVLRKLRNTPFKLPAAAKPVARELADVRPTAKDAAVIHKQHAPLEEARA